MTKYAKTTVEPTPEAAEAAGFAAFNGNPHLCVELPDGGFTITVKTTEGKRITFAFQPYETGGPPQCVDVCYHDDGATVMNGGEALPVFDAIHFAAGKMPYDTRDDGNGKAGIICVLMDKPKGEAA